MQFKTILLPSAVFFALVGLQGEIDAMHTACHFVASLLVFFAMNFQQEQQQNGVETLKESLETSQKEMSEELTSLVECFQDSYQKQLTELEKSFISSLEELRKSNVSNQKELLTCFKEYEVESKQHKVELLDSLTQGYEENFSKVQRGHEDSLASMTELFQKITDNTVKIGETMVEYCKTSEENQKNWQETSLTAQEKAGKDIFEEVNSVATQLSTCVQHFTEQSQSIRSSSHEILELIQKESSENQSMMQLYYADKLKKMEEQQNSVLQHFQQSVTEIQTHVTASSDTITLRQKELVESIEKVQQEAKMEQLNFQEDALAQMSDSSAQLCETLENYLSSYGDSCEALISNHKKQNQCVNRVLEEIKETMEQYGHSTQVISQQLQESQREYKENYQSMTENFMQMSQDDTKFLKSFLGGR